MEHRNGRSLFWPIILVGIGLTWLLVNLGYLPAFSIGQLLRLWPVILIVLGVDMIFGRRFPWAGTVIGLLAVGGIIAFLYMSPRLGIETAPQLQTETFTEPVGKATSAVYSIEGSSEPIKISSPAGSGELVHAVITHRAIINFDVSGTTEKTIHMSETTDSSSWLVWNFSPEPTKWDIQLAEGIPSELNLDGASGSLDIDLSGVELTQLKADMASGSSEFILPVTEEAYSFDLDSSSGSVRVIIPEGASVNLNLNSSSGAVNIQIPTNAALQVEVFDEGSGSLNIPDGLEKVSAGGSGGSLGVWQTKGFDTASAQIFIRILDQGSGSINIR